MSPTIRIALWVGALGYLSPVCLAADLSFTNDGLQIDAGSMGVFTLTYPALVGEDGQTVHPAIEKSAEADRARVRYEGGASAELEIRAGEVTTRLSGVPESAHSVRMEMLIDFGYAQGGSWRIGDTGAMPFPQAQPELPFLHQGHAGEFELTNFEDRSLSLRVPENCYQELQDNREWGWKIFAWSLLMPCEPGDSVYTVGIAQSEPVDGARVIVVDQYGQDAQAEYPGKVHNDEDLRAGEEAERAFTEALSLPDLDPYGGLPGSGTELGLTATGFFHVEQVDGQWTLVDPVGNAYFLLGLCAFGPCDDYTTIEGRESIYEWLPPYEGEFQTAYHPQSYWSRRAFSFYLANVIRKEGQPFDVEAWRARMIERVRPWGFNAAGAFSSGAETYRAAGFPYVAHLPLQLPWALERPLEGLRGFFDPFDTITAARIDELFAEQVAPAADDPLIIGYYLENEQACEDIPRVIPQLTGDEPCKLELVAMLRERYQTIEDFNAAWGMDAKSFDELTGQGLPVATASAAADMRDYTERFLDRYYSLLTTTFRKYDTNHMLIGNRWQPGTANDETLVRVAGQYMDVISVNYYTYGLDVGFLERLYAWSGGRPMLLSEWHYCSPSDTGLPGGGPEVSSQRERGLAYRNYVEQAAAMGFIVGSEWFTLIDQARTGRFFQGYTGENGNTGVISVTDTPWFDFLEEAVRAHAATYEIRHRGREPFRYEDPKFAGRSGGTKTVHVPRAPGLMTIDGSRNDWPGTPPSLISQDRLVQGADAGGVEMAFRMCWDDQHLYLIADVADSTPMRNEHEGADLWQGDGLELFLGHEQVDDPGQLLFSDRQVLIGAGLANGEARTHVMRAPEAYDCEVTVVPAADGTGYTLEVAIPFSALGFEPQPGQKLLFDLAVNDSLDGVHRVRQLMWNGSARNSSDRTYWGRATLAE